MFSRSNVEGRVVDVFVVLAGGNAGLSIGLTFPYENATNPVTKVVRTKS